MKMPFVTRGFVFEVAKRYKDGKGASASDQNAIVWFLKSGDSGDPEGYEEAALLYRHSEQIERNNKKAIELYKKAAFYSGATKK